MVVKGKSKTPAEISHATRSDLYVGHHADPTWVQRLQNATFWPLYKSQNFSKNIFFQFLILSLKNLAFLSPLNPLPSLFIVL